VTTSLAGLDRTTEEAAQNLGANPWVTFWRITLPAIRPGMVAGALFGFVAYMTYDLTNLATLRDWPPGLSFIDMGWGCIATALAATAGRLAADRFVAQ